MKRQRQHRKHRFSFSHARSLHVENLEDRRMLSGVPGDFNGHDADDYDRWSGEVAQLANRIPDYCTFGGDTSCNTDDLDALYAVFNTHVPLTDPLFDLNSDTAVGEADLGLWLNLAAVENGYFSPYLRGDTDLDHDVDTFDLTQMIINYTGAVGSGTTWTTGDIDGDKDTDIVDLTKAIMNFTGATMPPTNNVPTLDPISDVTIDEDAPQQTVGLTGITAGDSDDVNITVTDNSTPVTLSFQDGLFPSPSYTGTRDVQILRTNSNTNFGSSQQLEADGRPDSASLLKWDLSAIAPGSTISAASIQLNITNSTKHNYELYALQRDWNESQATWKQYATGENWSKKGANGTGDFNPTVLGQFAAKNRGTYTSSLNAAGVAIVQSWVDHASTNHGLIVKDYVKATNGMTFSSRETSTASLHPKLVVFYISGDTPNNEPPVVNAGEDQTINVSSLALLNGTASDDGNPNPPGEVTSSWSKVSGPGNVVFNDPTAVVTNAQFDTAGTYVLRLTTDDGELQAQDNVTVVVEQPVTNQPSINVGTHNLNADMPHQIIQIDITGVDVAQGVNFNIQVADGGPEAGGSILGPKITRVDIVGGTLGGLTIFTGNNSGQTDTLVLPQVWESTTTTSSGTVTPNGVLGFVEIDTTGFFNSVMFDLIMSNTVNYPTDLAGIPVDVTDGKIIITPLVSADDD